MANSMFHRIAGFFRGEVSPPAIYLTAFGKHPGWDDHIGDLGDSTPLLAAFKNRLYDQGISSQIDSGKWERLQPSQQVEGFDHQIVLIGGSDVIVGHIWSSRDGKGRSRYPLVGCAQCHGISPERAIREVLPRIDAFGPTILELATAREVRDAVNQLRAELSAIAAEPAAAAPLGGQTPTGISRRGQMALVYHLDRELGICQSGAATSPGGSAQLRVPTVAGGEPSILAWLGFLSGILPGSVPILAMAPRGRDWIDLIAGPLSPPHFYCLRVNRLVIPNTTDIPYEMDADFIERAGRLIDSAAAKSATAVKE